MPAKITKIFMDKCKEKFHSRILTNITEALNTNKGAALKDNKNIKEVIAYCKSQGGTIQSKKTEDESVWVKFPKEYFTKWVTEQIKIYRKNKSMGWFKRLLFDFNKWLYKRGLKLYVVYTNTEDLGAAYPALRMLEINMSSTNHIVYRTAKHLPRISIKHVQLLWLEIANTVEHELNHWVSVLIGEYGDMDDPEKDNDHKVIAKAIKGIATDTKLRSSIPYTISDVELLSQTITAKNDLKSNTAVGQENTLSTKDVEFFIGISPSPDNGNLSEHPLFIFCILYLKALEAKNESTIPATKKLLAARTKFIALLKADSFFKQYNLDYGSLLKKIKAGKNSTEIDWKEYQ